MAKFQFLQRSYYGNEFIPYEYEGESWEKAAQSYLAQLSDDYLEKVSDICCIYNGDIISCSKELAAEVSHRHKLNQDRLNSSAKLKKVQEKEIAFYEKLALKLKFTLN